MAATPPDEVFQRVDDLNRRGLALQAYEAVRGFAPLREWDGAEGRLAAASLARQLGAPRLADVLCRLAWGRSPDRPRVLLRYGFVKLERHGPLAAIDFLDAAGAGADWPEVERVRLLTLRAAALSALRDFERAHRLLDEALAVDDSDEWPLLVRVQALHLEDRYEEALEAARSVAHRHPSSTQTVQAVAGILQLLGRDQEALETLSAAMSRFESGAIAMQLAGVCSELELYERLLPVLDRVEALWPLLESEGQRMLAIARSEAIYGRGELDASASEMRRSRSPFHLAIAARIETPGTPRGRVLLPVEFVRQHHHTCAPATLAAVTAFWDRKADHLEVADQICYDGTTAHGERAWAEAHGWIAREFTLTWDAAVALIDRGVPFTLATRHGETGHLQAVIGYDALRGTLFIRDPFYRHRGELLVEGFLEDQSHAGPRAMALVPEGQVSRLDGVTLPDAETYDRYFRMESALLAFDRPGAVAELATLNAESADHRLTALARLSLASYDVDAATQLAELERWIERYPTDVAMRLRSFACLERLGLRSELARRLTEAVASPISHPLLWSAYATTISEDARRGDEAEWWLRRAIRAEPASARHLEALARVLSRRSRTEASLATHRLAACLADKDEDLAASYARAACAASRTDEGLAFLRTRFDRLGRRSPGPGVTLAVTLMESERAVAGFEVLASTLEAHPEDGRLLIIAADAHRQAGRTEAAALLVERAAGRAKDVALLAARAQLAVASGDRSAARAAWTELAVKDPHSISAHESLAILDALDGGVTAALNGLAAAVGRAPENVDLQRLRLKWLHVFRADLVEPDLRRFVDAYPHDAPARLALAILLIGQRRLDGAAEQLREVLESSPDDASVQAALGDLRFHEGCFTEAIEAYRAAIRLSADQVDAMHALVFRLASDRSQRRAALVGIGDELVRQASSDDGVRAFDAIAASILEPDEIREVLAAVSAARPDAWAPRSALLAHDAAHGRPEAALDQAVDASRRFPLNPGAWLDLADVRRRLGDLAGEIEALRRALSIQPALRGAMRLLARAQLTAGRPLEALAVLDAHPAILLPSPEHEADAATIAWSAGDREGAVTRLCVAIRLKPGVGWGWSRLAAWGSALGRDLVEPLAREIAAERPDDPMAWYGLALALDGDGHLMERLAALERAGSLAPWDVEVHDARARNLAEAGRFDDALAACAPAVWTGNPPLELRGRGAWVLYQQGLRVDAVEALRRLTRENPGYVWGWRQLADWAREANNLDGYADASERVVVLDRSNAWAHAFLGDALRLKGDRRRAKESLRAAIGLDPALEPAASALFELCLEDGELADAAATLDAGRPTLSAAWTALRELQLACRRQQFADAIDAFRRLCRLPSSRWNDLAAACDTLVSASLELQADGELRKAMADPSAVTFVGVVWVAFMTASRRLDVCADRLRELIEKGESWILAAGRYLGETREAGNKTQFIEFAQEHANRLRRDLRTWVAVIDTFRNWGQLRLLEDWIADWNSRQDLQPSHWLHLSLALRELGRDDDASRAVTRGISGHDGSVPALQVWSAYDEAERGRADAARRLMSAIDAEALEPQDRFVLGLAAAMGAMGDTLDVPRLRFARARFALGDAVRRFPGFVSSTTLRRAYRRTVAWIAATRGGWHGWAWRSYLWLMRAT